MQNRKYTAIVAVTIDGKIARHGDGGSDWTSLEDKAFMRAKLQEMDVVVVGRTTYQQYQKPLSKRNCVVFTRSVSKSKKESENLTYFNPQVAKIENLINENKYQNICVLGGSQIYSYFLENKLLSELFITVEPIIFGNGIPLFNTEVANQMWSLVEIKKMNETGSVLLHYKNKNTNEPLVL